MLSPEEATLLANWEASDPAHAQALREIAALWQKLNATDVPIPDVTAELAALKLRIQSTPKQTTKTYSWRWAAAAALVLAIGALWFFKDSSTQTAPMLTFSTQGQPAAPLTLSDGSVVWLNRNSTLHYPATFEGAQRRIALEGEAYFKVAHQPEKPFMVDAGGCTTTALGTTFNIRTHPAQQTTTIALETGKVSVESKKDKLLLTPGQSATFDAGANKLAFSNEQTAGALAWHSGTLLLDKTPLAAALLQLESIHGISFILENQSLATCPYSAYFPNNNLQPVLLNLEAVFHFILEKTPEGYRLKGGQCAQ